MDAIIEFFRNLQNLEELIRWGGLAVMAFIVFAETGLLVGFFLPGDSLLFTAGALVGAGFLKAPNPLPQDALTGILALNLVLMAAAVLGDATGYWFGRKVGPGLFARPNSRLFNREHLLKTQAFYDKHGSKTIILARWMPFARTFAPIVAGVAQMSYKTFAFFNLIGGVTWVFGMTMLGYLLGNNPFVKQHNEKVIILIIILSLMPALINVLKERRASKAQAEESARRSNG